MRRQYHSRQVEGHELIWDVHRLVELLSRQFPVKEVPLAGIVELDECSWFPAGSGASCRDVANHARLIAQTDLIHPIILTPDGRVMDGMHRVCKALLENRATIAAVQFEITPQPDHVDVAVETLSYHEPW
jgi:hypothetical protein